MLADVWSNPPSEVGLFDMRTPVPRGALVQLGRAWQIWDEASQAHEPAERFRLAHVAALRGAAAVLAARPSTSGRRTGRPTSAWRLLDESAPECADWSAFFRDSAVRRAAVEAGSDAGIVSREADEMLTAVSDFLAEMARMVGVPADWMPAQPAQESGLRRAS